MRRSIFAAALLLLGFVSTANSGPTTGPELFDEMIRAGKKEDSGEIRPGIGFFVKTFRGNQRASVSVVGDHDPSVKISIIVYDKNDNIIVQDRGTEQAIDYVAVFWYPPRDATYRVEIRSYGVIENKVTIVVK